MNKALLLLKKFLDLFGLKPVDIIIFLLMIMVAWPVIDKATFPSDSRSEVRNYTTLTYCSEQDPQCQPGVADLDYVVNIAEQVHEEAYGYRRSKIVSVKLEEVKIKLNNTAKDSFEEDIFLYSDSNGNGEYDSSDQKVARSFLKNKNLIFEDLNYVIKQIVDEGSETSDRDEDTRARRKFFIVSENKEIVFPKLEELDEFGEVVKTPLIKSIETKAIDLDANNSELNGDSSFADLTLFSDIEKKSISRQEFLASNDMFEASDDDKLVLKSGTYDIDENLIIPSGLQVEIQAGAKIRIAAGKNFISYSPMDILGEESNKVVIEKKDNEPFETFSIIGQTKGFGEVTVRHLDVSGGYQADINGAFLSGMFNVYRADFVTVLDSKFTGGTADDGLNIKNAPIRLERNIFDSNNADAFDGDFVEGDIKYNLFVNNGNDSLDFSGSNVNIQYNRIEGSGDKCISVGEATTLFASQNILNGCFIGAEVKDKSDAVFSNNVISNNTKTAFSAYIKKPFFGEPKLSYSENVILGNPEEAIDLALQAESSNNITSGNINDLRRQLPWLEQALQNSPSL